MEVDSGHALVIVDVEDVGTSATDAYLIDHSKVKAKLVYSFECCYRG